MEAELLQRLRRMGMELEHLRSRLADLALLQEHLHARQRQSPHHEEPPLAAGLPVAVENGLEEFLRAYV